jgi:hypothetical protein
MQHADTTRGKFSAGALACARRHSWPSVTGGRGDFRRMLWGAVERDCDRVGAGGDGDGAGRVADRARRGGGDVAAEGRQVEDHR